MISDKILRYKRAEGYYRRDAALGNVDGAWKNFVQANKDRDSRSMVHEPRNMYAEGQLVQNTNDGSRPGTDHGPGMLVKEAQTLKQVWVFKKEIQWVKVELKISQENQVLMLKVKINIK
jgi:hypothetical protein